MMDALSYSTEHDTWFWPAYQCISITFASLAPAAAITYSLLYGISTKQKVITIDAKCSRSMIAKNKDTHSMSSLDEYAELLEDDAFLEDPGYQGNLKVNENFKVQDRTVERSKLSHGNHNRTSSIDSESSFKRR